MKAPEYARIKEGLEILRKAGVQSYYIKDNQLRYKDIPVNGILIPMLVDTGEDERPTGLIL